MNDRARSLMVLGTGSHVGKSLLTAAFCRIFAQQGYRVAPFKAQNMSLNSAATPEGLEIGRAQALQAEAAGIPASVHMNPVLIKPSGNMTSQVIVQGRMWKQLSAADYHRRRVEELLPAVRESYEALASTFDVIVLEGAGSPAEINLKAHDIVNMRMADLADAPCILVGDIDRGGVFASLLGTVELLEPHERERIAGFVINKFRGDLSLLTPGVEMMEARLGKPCFGVVPYLPNLTLDEEDSVGLPMVHQRPGWTAISDSPDRPLRVAIVALPAFSNFTDFDALHAEPSVDAVFCGSVEACRNADVIVVPGSKQTMDDLAWMRQRGLDRFLQEHAQRGLVVGICGGMQMLGRSIEDPGGFERHGGVDGVGLLPIMTTMTDTKVTVPARGRMIADKLFDSSSADVAVSGYEIHLGETTYLEGAIAFAKITRGGANHPYDDGCVSENGRVIGTYLHGIFDDDAFRHHFLHAARKALKLNVSVTVANWHAAREASMNRLAETVETHLDMARIFKLTGLPYCTSTPAGSIG